MDSIRGFGGAEVQSYGRVGYGCGREKARFVQRWETGRAGGGASCGLGLKNVWYGRIERRGELALATLIVFEHTYLGINCLNFVL
jgi:hypothetical protein